MKEYLTICVDDDEQFLQSLQNLLPSRVDDLCPDFQCTFEFTSSPEELFEILSDPSQSKSLAMVISDQMMPGISGIELIEKLKGEYPDIVSILLTGHGGLDSAKYAINRHLLDQYVSKPIEDVHVFTSLVANLLKRHHLNLEERERTEQLARTVVQLQNSNEEISAMQAAAEEIAMLSKCFKSLDLSEVVAVASQEVPKLFTAQRAVLCFPPDGCPVDLVGRKDCSCPQEELLSRRDAQTAIRDGEVSCGEIPDVCANLGGKSPNLIVPLSISAFASTDGDDEDQQGYLCMCNMDSNSPGCTNLMEYKAGLAREILNANLTNAKLYQQVKPDSETDYLTGARTRRALEEKLEAEHERAVRYNSSFCVVIVDVDRFKEVNDRSGHIAGDQALQQLTDILTRHMRRTDILARYGGDEFVILMPETELEGAVSAAERMREEAQHTLAPCEQTVTISCGVAGWSGGESESGTDVLRRADAALHRAKCSGRNNVQIEKAA